MFCLAEARRSETAKNHRQRSPPTKPQARCVKPAQRGGQRARNWSAEANKWEAASDTLVTLKQRPRLRAWRLRKAKRRPSGAADAGKRPGACRHRRCQRPRLRRARTRSSRAWRNSRLTRLSRSHACTAAMPPWRGGQRPPVPPPQPALQAEPKRMFKGFGGWGNFMPARSR